MRGEFLLPFASRKCALVESFRLLLFLLARLDAAEDGGVGNNFLVRKFI
jgi:hypothetical protein